MTQFEYNLSAAKKLEILLRQADNGTLRKSDDHVLEYGWNGWCQIHTGSSLIAFTYDLFYHDNMVNSGQLQIQLESDTFRILGKNCDSIEDITMDVIQDTDDEALYFQNSLLLDENQNAGLLISSYLVKHLRDTKIKSILIKMDKLDSFIEDSYRWFAVQENNNARIQ